MLDLNHKTPSGLQGYDNFRHNFPKLLLWFSIDFKISFDGHNFEDGCPFKVAWVGPCHENFSIYTLSDLLTTDETAEGENQ